MKKSILLVVVLLTITASVQAVVIPVVNGSFEQDAATANSWNWNDQDGTGVNVIVGWNYDYTASPWPSANDTGVWSGSGGQVVPSDGLRMAFVRHSDGQAAEQASGPWQELGYTIVEGETYVFTMDVQRRQGGTACSLTFNYHDGGSRTEIVKDIIDMTAQNESQWATYSVSFTAQTGADYIGKNLGIEFNNESATDSWQHFDNARVVPEPVTLLMLGLGSLALRYRKN